MADPALLETLPQELIKEVMSALRRLSCPEEEESDIINAFNSAMQTCRAMRLICSGFITKLVVAGFGALERFPRHAVVKRLELRLGSAIKTHIWLTRSDAATTVRLKYVENVKVKVDDKLHVRLEYISIEKNAFCHPSIP